MVISKGRGEILSDIVDRQTMKTCAHALLLLMFLAPAGAWADAVELNQSELRAAVADRGAISTRRLIAGVEDFTSGDVVDIRAFEVDGVVTYRIVVQLDNGQVSILMVDATTGRAVSVESDVGRQVASVAAESNGNPQFTNNRNANANGRRNRNGDRGNNGRGRGSNN